MIKPKSLTSLSIFFPCYNEALNVGPMIEQAVRVAEEYGVDYEVLVVDDGSQDRSARVVRDWSKKNPQVRLIQHAKNQGYGAALRTGLMLSVAAFGVTDLVVGLGWGFIALGLFALLFATPTAFFLPRH